MIVRRIQWEFLRKSEIIDELPVTSNRVCFFSLRGSVRRKRGDVAFFLGNVPEALLSKSFEARRHVLYEFRCQVRVTVLYHSCCEPYEKDVAFFLVSLTMPSQLNRLYGQDYWVFSLCPSSGILYDTKERNVSKTGSVSVLR
jgi:hypothetical protein